MTKDYFKSVTDTPIEYPAKVIVQALVAGNYINYETMIDHLIDASDLEAKPDKNMLFSVMLNELRLPIATVIDTVLRAVSDTGTAKVLTKLELERPIDNELIELCEKLNQ